MKKIIFALSLVTFLPCIVLGSDDWQVEKSTHFIVYYKNAPFDFVNKLTEKSEYYYNRIADDLGFVRYNFWLWDNRAKIYIHDDSASYQSATGMPSWSGGCAQVNEKTIHTFLDAQGFFDAVLPHEMGHIIFREFVGFHNYAIPLWLDEGVAIQQEKSKYHGADSLVRGAIRAGNFMNLGELTEFSLHFSFDNNSVQLFYSEAFSLVNFLLRQFGKDKFVLFCQNLRDKKDLQRALSSTYPFNNIQELDSAWQSYLKK